jgi:transcriptional regulator with XRE-family HTH domain
MIISKIGEAIKRSGYTREYIADYMGISKQQLSNWVTGHSPPTTERLFKLAHLLGCETDDLYDYVDDEN